MGSFAYRPPDQHPLRLIFWPFDAGLEMAPESPDGKSKEPMLEMLWHFV
jgi:hypothetical protein